MSEQHQMIQNIGKFFGWIAGITAGVSALLSVAGFMLLQSHAHLLGVSGVFHHTVEDCLYQGGNFFINTLFWALPVSIIGKITLGFAVIVEVYLLGKRLGMGKNLKLFKNTVRGITQRLNTKEAFQQPWVQWTAIIAAAFLFLFFISHILPSSKAKDLLVVARYHPEIAKRVTQNELDYLKDQYIFSVLCVTISVLILWGINRIFQSSKMETSSAFLYIFDRLSGKYKKHHIEDGIQENKGELPFVFALGHLFLYLLLLVQLVLLPVQYGKAVYPNTFHRVSNLMLDEKLQGKIPQSQNIYLLNEREDELILYYGDTQEISLVKKDNILNIALKSRENIFQ